MKFFTSLIAGMSPAQKCGMVVAVLGFATVCLGVSATTGMDVHIGFDGINFRPHGRKVTK